MSSITIHTNTPDCAGPWAQGSAMGNTVAHTPGHTSDDASAHAVGCAADEAPEAIGPGGGSGSGSRCVLESVKNVQGDEELIGPMEVPTTTLETACEPTVLLTPTGVFGILCELEELDASLFAAVEKNDVPGIRSALGRGANINAQDSEGKTPGMRAVLRGHRESLAALMERGFDNDLRDARGKNLADHLDQFGSMSHERLAMVSSLFSALSMQAVMESCLARGKRDSFKSNFSTALSDGDGLMLSSTTR